MIVCGIDPGREKVGIALSVGGNLLLSAILTRQQFAVAMENLMTGCWETLCFLEGVASQCPKRCVERIYLGNGTAGREIGQQLSEMGYEFVLVDERDTTLIARKLYWKLHPPQGVWRLFPLSLRVPPRAIDDLAAWAIALRGEERGQKIK